MSDTLTALVAKWREFAKDADRLATKSDAKNDGANSHAFRKERRVWKSCADELDAALQQAAPARSAWQPIATAPKDGTPFIAASTMDAFRAFYDTEQEVWVCEDDGLWFGALSHPPTHWTELPPLPAPPQTGGTA